MISSETIKEFALKKQTTELNIAREYLQNLFLSYFYQQDGSETILFKGGTALKLIDDKAISNELKLFLPRSYWPVLREFRKSLLKELKRR